MARVEVSVSRGVGLGDLQSSPSVHPGLPLVDHSESPGALDHGASRFRYKCKAQCRPPCRTRAGTARAPALATARASRRRRPLPCSARRGGRGTPVGGALVVGGAVRGEEEGSVRRCLCPAFGLVGVLATASPQSRSHLTAASCFRVSSNPRVCRGGRKTLAWRE
jgi:hypothetical protein